MAQPMAAKKDHRTAQLSYVVSKKKGRTILGADTSLSASMKTDYDYDMSCLEDKSEDWFKNQMLFSQITRTSNPILDPIFCDTNRSNVLVERVDSALDHWLDKRFRHYGQQTPTNQECLKHWTSSADPLRWCKYIRKEFLIVFGRCMLGLRNIHCSERFHGRLKEGIVIRFDGPFTAFLYDMELPSNSTNIHREQWKDINDLKKLIISVINFPFNRPGCVTAAPSIPEDIDKFFLAHLNARLSTKFVFARQSRHWTLNPVIFWKADEMIKFLYSMHDVLFGYSHNTLYGFTDTADLAFPQLDWAARVRALPPSFPYSKELIDVLDHFKKQPQQNNSQDRDNPQDSDDPQDQDKPPADPYARGPIGMKKLLYWRHCMQHKPRNRPKHLSWEYWHSQILPAVPELIPEVVACLFDIMESNWNEDMVKGLFKNMGWKC